MHSSEPHGQEKQAHAMTTESPIHLAKVLKNRKTKLTFNRFLRVLATYVFDDICFSTTRS